MQMSVNLSLYSSQSNRVDLMDQLCLQHKAQIPSALHAYTQVVDSGARKDHRHQECLYNSSHPCLTLTEKTR